MYVHDKHKTFASYQAAAQATHVHLKDCESAAHFRVHVCVHHGARLGARAAPGGQLGVGHQITCTPQAAAVPIGLCWWGGLSRL